MQVLAIEGSVAATCSSAVRRGQAAANVLTQQLMLGATVSVSGCNKQRHAVDTDWKRANCTLHLLALNCNTHLSSDLQGPYLLLNTGAACHICVHRVLGVCCCAAALCSICTAAAVAGIITEAAAVPASADGWISGTLSVSGDCQGLPANVCKLCSTSKDSGSCLKCAKDARAQYNKKPVNYLIKNGSKAQNACSVCAGIADTGLRST